MEPLALVIAVAAGLSVALAFSGGVLSLTGGRSRVQERLLTTTVSGGAGGVEISEASLLRDRSGGAGLLERLLSRGNRSDQTRIMLERADLPLRPGEYLMLRILSALAGTAIGVVMANVAGAGPLSFLLIAAAGVAGFMAPAFYARRRTRKRARLIDEQLVEMAELMASSMAAGFGYMQALIAIAEQLDRPMSDEIRKMVDDVNLGGDIDEALQALNERLDSKDFDIVATAITIQRTSGGNLGDILKGVAETIRARQSFKREVLALTSQERFSAIIIAAFPLLLVGVLALMVPEMYGRLLTDTIGRIALGVALTLDATAYFVIKAMTRIEA